jgi:hypothetical protein
VFPWRAALELGDFVARQETRKAGCVASAPSQSPIGVVKRNHALNLASRIKNAYLARTKSSADFCIADCLSFCRNMGSTPGDSKTHQPTCEALLQRLSSRDPLSSRNTVSFSSLRTTNLFPSSRCASATKIVLSSRSTRSPNSNRLC